jgi:hypothetical protein
MDLQITSTRGQVDTISKMSKKLWYQTWKIICPYICTKITYIPLSKCRIKEIYNAVFALTHLPKPGTSKTGFGQVKIMKEFVWININFFLNLVFGKVDEKN